MDYTLLHTWDITPKEAIALQKDLAGRCVFSPLDISRVKIVAGVDVSVKNGRSKAAIVVLKFPGMEIVEEVTALSKPPFPYVPGLLSFREGPVILDCVRKLRNAPDAFIFDGQGTAHPRGFGIACHMGLFLGKPSIGSAKSRLCGEYAEPGGRKGEYSPLKDKSGRAIGAVLRTRDGVTPIYVSPGHMADLDSCLRLVLACTGRYRLPEPIRRAHRAASLTDRA